MHTRMSSFAAALLVPATLYALPALAQPSQSVWDGVYTESQAERGAMEYARDCLSCHGPNLEGNGEAAALAGGKFLSDFDGLTMGALFNRITSTMPLKAPDSLSMGAYADVLAYILKVNGFPAGQKPLDHRAAFLEGIAFEATNPNGGTGPEGIRQADTPDPAPAPVPAPAPAAGGFRSAPPADLAALDAANAASGVLSPAASDKRNAANSQPDPYQADAGFFKLPAGRTMGSTSAVAVDSKGHVWVADRCAANSCAGSTLAPIMEFDAQGQFIKAFGAGMLAFPHGLYIDRRDHIWVTDEGKGADVLEFDQSGKLLRTLGKHGVSREGPDTFSQPSAVLVAPNGDIFVADGHDAGADHSARVVKLNAQGKFLKQWGGHGVAAGHFDALHCLAMDNEGRLYVGDRWNSRIQVFDQNGKLLSILTQFSRPSGCYIDRHDILYVADSESRAPMIYGYHPGWRRGIRVGSLSDGIVTAFIPEDTPDPDKYATSGAEGIWVDPSGVIYGAEVKQMAVVRYVKQ